MTRLSQADLPGKTRPENGVVHLGLGAFFRAHVAMYLADVMDASGGNWGVVGVSLRSPSTRDKLAAQDNVYTAAELGPEGAQYRVMGDVTKVLVAPESPADVLAAMAVPAIRIVTLTVTEKGYHHEPASGLLRTDDPDILHDLTNPNAPRTALGFLVRALDLRRKAGHRPFTVLSCDNLPENGRMVRALVQEFAQLIDPALADWIASEVRFPSCMVDRIVPATTQADIDSVEADTGRLDLAPVMHEPFCQWVVEDDFVDGDRPPLETVGVQMVNDVTPFEKMKLRCLNGTHSSLAYLGYLAGHATIHDAVSDPVFAALCAKLWQAEIIPTLTPPQDTDLTAYSATLLDRYRNPSIRHATWQIAMDGSQKLPQRLLGTISDNLDQNRPCAGLMLAVAAWMKYASGQDEAGHPIDVRDPLADRTRGLWDGNASAEARVDAYLDLGDVFGELANRAEFRQALITACDLLETHGARGAVERITS